MYVKLEAGVVNGPRVEYIDNVVNYVDKYVELGHVISSHLDDAYHLTGLCC